jgi:serine/threonine protein kinase
MPSVKEANAEPLPGYRLLEPLGRGGFGEVWKCLAPGGLTKAIKFIAGAGDLAGGAADQELAALQRIKDLRHPFLLSVERVEVVDGEVVLVTELADRSLRDLFAECRKAGLAGVPRDELLFYLHEAAEVLDLMNLGHGLQHLDVKPHNLFLIGRHVKVADFGLVSSLAELHGGAPTPGALTPLYAAPETFHGRVSLYSDQFSLAVTYAELLAGTPPWTARNARALAVVRLSQPPDLARLPEADRGPVSKALALDPRERYPSCTAFIDALEGLPTMRRSTGVFRRPPTAQTPRPAAEPLKTGTDADFSPGDLAATQVKSGELALPPDPADACTRRAGAGGLPGFEFLDCLQRHGGGEVWRARDAAGRLRLVKLIFGLGQDDADRPDGPLARLRRLRHDLLAPAEAVFADGRLVLIADPGEGSLADDLKEAQGRGQNGLPRDELLGHLDAVAGALDALYESEKLQHLGLTPRHLVFYPGGRLRLTDFGVAELVWLKAGLQAAALTPRYAAPELLHGRLSRACDQYSLALIYHELLTGAHPFRNLNPRQMAAAQRGSPDLSLLPGPDRAVVLRALSADPARRFPDGTSFLKALAAADRRTGARPARAAGLGPALPTAQAREALAALALAAAGGAEARQVGPQRFVVWPGERAEHRCYARLVPGTLRLKLDGWRLEHGATLLRRGETSAVYKVTRRGSFWQRLRGRPPGVEVEVYRHAGPDAPAAVTPLVLVVRPVGCVGARAAALLDEMAQPLLAGLRACLQAGQERRRHERWPLDGDAEAELPEVGLVPCRTRDVSPRGLGLRLPCRPPAGGDLRVRLRGPTGTPVVLAGRVIHVTPAPDDACDVGLCVGPEEG